MDIQSFKSSLKSGQLSGLYLFCGEEAPTPTEILSPTNRIFFGGTSDALTSSGKPQHRTAVFKRGRFQQCRIFLILRRMIKTLLDFMRHFQKSSKNSGRTCFIF